jgi:membrane protease YdiL (CAAX protease family)
VSSFLFGVYFMNVYLLVPAFVLGIVLGVLALRSASLLPGIIVHLGCYALILGGGKLEPVSEAFARLPGDWELLARLGIAGTSAILAGLLIVRQVRTSVSPGRLTKLLQLPEWPGPPRSP